MRSCSSSAGCGIRSRVALCDFSCSGRARAGWKRALLIASMFTFVAGVPGSARADELRDEASGLTVVAPDGYSVARLTPTETFTARFAVKRPDDRDTGCQVAFTPLPQNAA